MTKCLERLGKTWGTATSSHSCLQRVSRSVLTLLIFLSICTGSNYAQTPIEPTVRKAMPMQVLPATAVTSDIEPAAETEPIANTTPSRYPHLPKEGESHPTSTALEGTRDKASDIQPGIQSEETHTEVTLPPNPKDTADSAYARKLYDLAITEYERFLEAFPGAGGRDAAWFRLAECYRAVNNGAGARRACEALLSEFQTGEFAGAGAYRFAEMLFEEKQYERAAVNFALAAKEVKDPTIAESALYLAARAFQNAEKPHEALTYYESVISGAANPYRSFALLAAAEIAASQDKMDQALAWYQEAAMEKKLEVSVPAAVKAATILVNRGKLAEARPFFIRAQQQAKDGPWRALADLGLIELDYQEKNYESLAKLSETQLNQVPAQSLARVFLLAANANRFRQQYARALKFYDRIVQDWPDSDAAKEAGFERLICLYNLKDTKADGTKGKASANKALVTSSTFLNEIDQFLQKESDPVQIAQAQLLKAETLFANHDYVNAAKAYKAARTKDLPEPLHANALYKEAWSLAQAKIYADAIAAYSDFLSIFPNHELVPKVVFHRGIANQNAGNSTAAKSDFDRVIKDHPTSADRELAMLQKALLSGAERKNDEMRQMFQAMLTAYPKTDAAAQAEFWIGWSFFEEKRYQDALTHLLNARRLDSARYGERASLRILLANYYLENLTETIKEANGLPTKNVPPEIYGWIASKSLEEKKYEQAEQYLDLFIKNQTVEAPPPERFLELAETRVRLGKYQAAITPVDKYLEHARTPYKRAHGLLVKAEASLGNRQFEMAERLAEEVLLLQPEGMINAKGRLLSGRVLNAQGKSEDAAKIFMAVAVLYDDPEITPTALKLAADAYKKADNLMESKNALNELQRRFPE